MNGSAHTAEVPSALLRLSQRLSVAAHAVSQGLGNFSVDLRLLFRRRDERAVLRHTQIYGFQMLVRAEEDVGRNIYYRGIHERRETAFFRSRIAESSICVDIGANIGYFSLLFASLSPQGAVHSFEPVPLNYHILSVNKLLNGFSNLTVNPEAVGDSEGNVDFVISEDSGFSSLVDTGRKQVAQQTSVMMTTLDGYCDLRGIARVDVLKVDVEGAEERVVIGAHRLLQDPARRPHTVMLELYEPMLKQHRSTIENILDQMKRFNYRPFVLCNNQLMALKHEHYSRFENVVFVCE